MNAAEIPPRQSWKQDLSPYLRVDRRRSLGQIASVVLPYLSIWLLAALIRPSAPVAIAMGLVATVFLTRMYSLFHDLTHNSMFESRDANTRWGHLLGYLLFTPYRWWQRQHRIHHAHTGDLEHRGVGEINTMTLTEYERATPLRRLGYRLYRNPLLMLLVGPTLVFLLERRFPQRCMTPRILASVVATNLALVAWVLGWSLIVGWQTFALIQGTTLIAGGAIAAWMLYIQTWGRFSAWLCDVRQRCASWCASQASDLRAFTFGCADMTASRTFRVRVLTGSTMSRLSVPHSTKTYRRLAAAPMRLLKGLRPRLPASSYLMPMSCAHGMSNVPSIDP
jgi:fatty acid desaturase